MQSRLEHIAIQPQMGAHHDVFQRIHVDANLQVLEGACDAQHRQAVRRHAGNGDTVEPDIAASGLVQTSDQVKERGFACAVGADDGIYRARV